MKKLKILGDVSECVVLNRLFHCRKYSCFFYTKINNINQNKLKEKETSVTVFLVNGVKLQGIITWFDDASLLLRRDGHTQLIYKHAVSTIMPGDMVEL